MGKRLSSAKKVKLKSPAYWLLKRNWKKIKAIHNRRWWKQACYRCARFISPDRYVSPFFALVIVLIFEPLGWGKIPQKPTQKRCLMFVPLFDIPKKWKKLKNVVFIQKTTESGLQKKARLRLLLLRKKLVKGCLKLVKMTARKATFSVTCLRGGFR